MGSFTSSSTLNYSKSPHKCVSSDKVKNLVLERARNGESHAVAAIYDEYQEAVRAFAIRIVGDEAVAEDLVHDVFIRLPRALRGFRGQSSLKTFVLGITANRARHFIRSATRQRAAYERYSKRECQQEADPEQMCSRRELAYVLTRAMDTLPVKQRIAFVLVEVEERTSSEAAVIIGIPAATVRSRVFHARKKLREYLDKEGVR